MTGSLETAKARIAALDERRCSLPPRASVVLETVHKHNGCRVFGPAHEYGDRAVWSLEYFFRHSTDGRHACTHEPTSELDRIEVDGGEREQDPREAHPEHKLGETR